MQGILLGSGTGVPSLRRNAPGYFLEVGTHQFLIDCGSGTLLQLERAGKSFKNLDALFITHVHADHIGDLTPLIHAMQLPGLHREKPFTLFGPPGFTEFFDRIVAPVATPPSAFPFQIVETPLNLKMEDVIIQSCPTLHSDRFHSSAYGFKSQGRSVVFSGDTDFDLGLMSFCQEADLVILECSTLDEEKVKGHMSAGLCGHFATQAHIKRLILSHFYPIAGPDSMFFAECRRHYLGPLDLGSDLMAFFI
ncbi:MAG: ribonuclease Z [Magnetococcales bacterium]|nr:ribonuclease Z [Magnetococcales bacterium]